MPPTHSDRCAARLAIVGAGRLGTALAQAFRAAGACAAGAGTPGAAGAHAADAHATDAHATDAHATDAHATDAHATDAHATDAPELIGPLGRGADGAGCDVVLLCVPDAQIGAAAAAIAPGPLVGHCSGATGLAPLAPHEAFSLHPLMTVTAAGAEFDGVTAAIDGSSERATDCARQLAMTLGMEPIRVAAGDRAAYHAAASIASNFLVTLEAAAEQLAASAGLERRMLVPLVRATVENWASLGGELALTGPVARGDQATVARQRDAVADRTPGLLPLFDALTDATRALAKRSVTTLKPAA